jgi:hypothetical protein
MGGEFTDRLSDRYLFWKDFAPWRLSIGFIDACSSIILCCYVACAQHRLCWSLSYLSQSMLYCRGIQFASCMPPRQVVWCSQSLTFVNYEFTWALFGIVASLGTRTVQEVVHSCGMSSAGLCRVDPVWPRSSRFGQLSATRLYGNLL